MLVFSIVLWGCSDKDDDKRDVKVINLEQTNWGGKMITTTINEVLEYSVGVSFYTSDSGFYDLLPINKEDPMIKNNFSYCINEKLLYIKGNPFLKGYWFILEYDNDILILEQGTGGEISKSVITLYRE